MSGPPALGAAGGPVLVAVHVLATSVWVGGFVAIGVVARVARSELEPATRVPFFRALGRSYGVVAGVALAVALATGAALLAGHPWTATGALAAALAAGLAAATVAGVVQARAMTRLRQRALHAPGDHELTSGIERRARRAGLLRASIGLLTLALVAVGSALAA